MTNDWYDIKFLESASNVRELIGNSTGRTPSAGIAREIAVCIQQGRLFFEAAVEAPIQIKPLQIYYGVVAFAQAVIVATQCRSLATLARAHGLSDITQDDAGVEGLTLRVEKSGTFQEFNDAIAPLGRIWFYDSNSMPHWYEKPFDVSAGLSGHGIVITEILARAPGLSGKFSQTFGLPGKTVPIGLDFGILNTGHCTLRIDDPFLFTDRAALIDFLKRLRAEYPFLERWRFVEALHAWGNSIIKFDNVGGGEEDDLSEGNLIPANNNGFTVSWALLGDDRPTVPAADILVPLSGGYVHTHTYAMQPINNVKLHEYALQFLGTFLLSSLVRYRPQIWQNAISRSVTAQSPADDRALSLIEKFLDDTLSEFPDMVVRVIDYQRK